MNIDRYKKWIKFKLIADKILVYILTVLVALLLILCIINLIPKQPNPDIASISDVICSILFIIDIIVFICYIISAFINHYFHKKYIEYLQSKIEKGDGKENGSIS